MSHQGKVADEHKAKELTDKIVILEAEIKQYE